MLAAACRVRDESFDGSTLRFKAEGIADPKAFVRLMANSKPKLLAIGGVSTPFEYDEASRTALLSFSHSGSVEQVELGF